MKGCIYTRIQKSNWDSDYFGAGKTPNSKRRWKSMLKAKANRQINKEILNF